LARYFTADHHLGHFKILKYQADTRPYESLHDMNVALTELWNADVGPEDVVHHLGDLCFGALSSAVRFISRLNGKIKITPGNHDYWLHDYEKKQRADSSYIIQSASGHSLEVMPLYHDIRINSKIVTLCHYPMRSWKASYYGSWHLHGHVHRQVAPWGMSMDVGIDQNKGRLYSEGDIVERMEGLNKANTEERENVSVHMSDVPEDSVPSDDTLPLRLGDT